VEEAKTKEGDLNVVELFRTLEVVTVSDVTRIPSQIESGDPSAAERLLPLVDAEMRKLAAAKLAQGKPGWLLQAIAWLHDACIRLVDVERTLICGWARWSFVTA
jgi:hypothetical protein